MMIELRSMKTSVSICRQAERAWSRAGIADLALGTSRCGHGIMSAATPRMTTADAPGGQPASHQRAAFRHGFDRVGRTTRLEAATGGGAKQKHLSRRNRPAIQPRGQDQNVLGRIHDAFVEAAVTFGDAVVASCNKPTRRSAVEKSRSTSPRALRAMLGRATSTRSKGRVSSARCSRKASRKSRRARLRWTALPTLRLTTTPTRAIVPGGSSCQFAMRQPLTVRRPVCLRRRKSRPFFRRSVRPRVRRGAEPAGMAAEPLTPASGVCGPRDGDWPKWPDRSCWSCAQETHAAACGGLSTVDTGVS